MKALKLTPQFIDNKENVFTYVGSWTPKLNQQSYFEVLRHTLIGDAISQSIKQYCCYTLYLFPFYRFRNIYEKYRPCESSNNACVVEFRVKISEARSLRKGIINGSPSQATYWPVAPDLSFELIQLPVDGRLSSFLVLTRPPVSPIRDHSLSVLLWATSIQV